MINDLGTISPSPIGRAVMSTDVSSLTTQDLEFLRRPLHGFLSVAGGPLPPQPGMLAGTRAVELWGIGLTADELR